jgi:hypothetical protein
MKGYEIRAKKSMQFITKNIFALARMPDLPPLFTGLTTIVIMDKTAKSASKIGL